MADENDWKLRQAASDRNMTPREITTLMHRLFYGDIPQTDGWVHLMVNGELSPQRVASLLDRYIQGDELLLYVDSRHCTASSKADAFAHLKNLLAHGNVRIADPRFHARILINSTVGAGVGSVAHEQRQCLPASAPCN